MISDSSKNSFDSFASTCAFLSAHGTFLSLFAAANDSTDSDSFLALSLELKKSIQSYFSFSQRNWWISIYLGTCRTN